MKKLLFASLLFPLSLNAQVTFKWLGISNFVISDQKTSIMFDPAVTRATIADYLPFRKVKTDEAEVNYWLDRCKITKVDGIFVNHTHYDHAGDASYMSKKFNATLYGSGSAMNIGIGQGVLPEKLKQIRAGDEIRIGDFKIKAYSTPHAPHFLNTLLMDGAINSPLAPVSSAWDYRVGETFSYYITHPKGTILFQAISWIHENDPMKSLKADALLLTIVNRRSSEELIQNRILSTGAKTIIPLHYDNFFFPMKRNGEIDLFWGVKLDEFKAKTKNFNVAYPSYCEEKTLF